MNIKIIIMALLVFTMVMPVNALSGTNVSPAKLSDDGALTIINNGDTPLNYRISFSQLMLKDNEIIIVDNKQPEISVSEATFRLNPGETKVIQVTVGNTNNLLYGVRIDGTPDTIGRTNVGVSVVVKIDNGGVPIEASSNVNKEAKYVPITLSGIPITVNYKITNNGDLPVVFEGRTFYPGDNGSVTKTYDNPLFSAGMVNCDGNQILVLPTPIVVLMLLVGLFIILRRKVDIKLK